MILFIFFILGLIVGSFVNVVIFRLNTKDPIIIGRSKCLFCGNQLSIKDLIPIISFLLLKGECRYCHQKISWQYPIVELTVAILFVIIGFYHFGFSEKILEVNWFILLRDLLAITALIIIFVYDLRFMEIPDEISLTTIIISFLLGIAGGLNWLSMLISAIIGLSFFLIQYLISQGQAIGGGDLRLGFLMGILLVNWPILILALVLSYLLGFFPALWLLINKKYNQQSKIPFAIFLVPATIISMLWGNQIMEWYLNLH